ncbi:2-methylcitrate dehydratase PrpD [Thermomonospora echinospora]|uniref:2-methylcitrate dehydratase PrpD n=1 Tax=Thermomonospora echinospora TaxID=1992 RepID=A0A1H5U1U8_9ACTN|nr:MmgE/PrpD family protein [Thermomonospora echinospora]SEF69023.1 2-methylcitrate dehydratase PrpD [Thermomonospora echinospora]
MSSRDTTIVAALADFAADAELPEQVTADVTGRVLDTFGNCLAAQELTDPAEPHEAVLRMAERWGGVGGSSVIGRGLSLPAPSAALINGTLAHALDFDDTHLPSVLHPSASVVPACLAVAESAGLSGADLCRAVAVGDEITNRLGMASYLPEVRNSVFFEKGWHATSICGTVGAAAGAALLMGLAADGIAHAMGIAASMGAGVIEANRTGGTVKRVHCGWAAHAAVVAATMAAEGITGPPTVFEGRFGFFEAFLDGRYDRDAITDGLGEQWELLRTVYKPYPSNHFTHPGIDAALALRAQGLRPEDVAEIELGVAAAPLRTIGEPHEEKVRPRTPYHAKFSGPYTVASALIGGGGLGLHLDDFTEAAFRDERRLELAAKVRVVADEECSEEFPRAFSAVLRVRTVDGSSLEHRVHSSRGGPEHPLTFDELRTKYALNASRVLTPEAASALAEEVRGLATRAKVGGLLDTALIG